MQCVGVVADTGRTEKAAEYRHVAWGFCGIEQPVLDRLAHRFFGVAGFGKLQFVCDLMLEVSLVRGQSHPHLCRGRGPAQPFLEPDCP
jgi:hypothetical protein